MKKRLLTIVAALIALVMSFALFACGGEVVPGNRDKSPDKAKILQTAQMSVVNYLGAATQSGAFSFELDTANSEPLGYGFDFVKSGEKIFVSSGEGDEKNESMFDISRGLLYVKTDAGWAYMHSSYPQGSVEYAMSVMAAAQSPANAAQQPDSDVDMFAYDAKTRTLSYSVDYAERINTAIMPVHDAYENGDSVIDLIDAYLEIYYDKIVESMPEIKTLVKPPLTVYKLGELLKVTAAFSKDKSLRDIVDGMDNATAEDYDALLVQAGLTGEALADAKARTVAQAVEGVLAYVNAKIDVKAIAGGDFSSLQALLAPFMSDDAAAQSQAIAELVQYVLISDVDVSTFEKDVSTLIDTVYDVLDTVRIKTLVDELGNISVPGMSTQIAALVGMGASVVKEAIVTGTSFKELSCTVVFELDSEYAVAKASVKFFASHDYAGETELPVLSDNDYSAKFTLTPSEYSDELVPDITLAVYTGEGGVVIPELVTAIARLDTETDASVYIETRMFASAQVSVVGAAIVDETNETTPIEGIANYDEKTRSVVFDYDELKAALLQAESNGARARYVSAVVKVNGGENYKFDVNVVLFVAADASPESAEVLLTDIAETLLSTREPNITSMPEG